MIIAHTENNLVVSQNSVMEFVNIILFHIYQCQIKRIVLDQITGTDRPIFLQYNGYIRIFLMKAAEQIRQIAS